MQMDIQNTPYHQAPVASCTVALARDSTRSQAAWTHPAAQFVRPRMDHCWATPFDGSTSLLAREQ
jgi:hypothetical protein